MVNTDKMEQASETNKTNTADPTNRERILKGALFLFRKQGYGATSTREIADSVPTSKANVYHHFRTKEGILHALFKPLFEEVEGWLSSWEATAAAYHIDQRDILEDYLNLVLENAGLVFLLGSDMAVVSYPEISGPAMRINDRLLALLVGSEPGVQDQVRAACAMSALQTVGVRFSHVEPEAVREAGLRAALGALGLKE